MTFGLWGMAESQVGVKAVVWGIYTGITYSALSGKTGATQEIQSTTFTRESDKKETRNARGQVINETFHNFRNTFAIEVIPLGDTKAHALAGEVLPSPGDIITVTETTGDPEQAATNGGKYICDRATKIHDNTNEHKFNLEMHQYTENDTAVVVS